MGNTWFNTKTHILVYMVEDSGYWWFVYQQGNVDATGIYNSPTMAVTAWNKKFKTDKKKTTEDEIVRATVHAIPFDEYTLNYECVS